MLSKIFLSLHDLRNIFENDFLKLTEQAFYKKNSAYIISSEIKSFSNIQKFNFKHFSELTSKLEIEDALDMLTSYINDCILKESISKFEVKALIQNCFYNIISTLETLDYNLEKLQSLKYKCFSIIDKIYMLKIY